MPSQSPSRPLADSVHLHRDEPHHWKVLQGLHHEMGAASHMQCTWKLSAGTEGLGWDIYTLQNLPAWAGATSMTGDGLLTGLLPDGVISDVKTLDVEALPLLASLS